MALAAVKDSTTVTPAAISPTRVDVPRSWLAYFVQPEVHMSVEAAAKLLGFAGAEELRKYTTPLLKHFEGVEPLGSFVGAHAFCRLVSLCAGKTVAARKLLDELSAGWRCPPGRELVSLPCEPMPSGGGSVRWPCCSPESAAMDPAPFERLRHYLHWRVRMRHFAGISCGIVRNGSLAFYQECGYADAEAKTRMTGDTLVRLFSMTKCIVAAVFMTYVEEPNRGIDLDDPVGKYIPAFAQSEMSVLPKRGQKENPPLEKPITLRQLITHTSGIGYGPTLGDPWPPAKGAYYEIYKSLCEDTCSGKISSLEEWCNALAKVPLKGQPGRFWDYSYSMDVLGRVVEVIGGKPLDILVEERMCGPLKMRDTSFVVPPEKVSRLGAWYKSTEIEGKPNLAHRLDVVDPSGNQSGWVGANVSKVLSAGGSVEVPLAMRGGMVSTFNDYLRFLMMLRNFGELDGIRVLKRETVQLMICNHIPASCYGKKNVFVFDKPGAGYSFLGQIQNLHPKQDKGAYSGEYGWGGLAGPAWTIDPRADLIILSMTQTAFVLDHEEYVRYAARRAIHQYIFGSVAAPSKATSYSPECFDVVRPKPAQEPAAAMEEAAMDKEFEEEHLLTSKTRVRNAKERAICPGPRLDRHPSDEEMEDAEAAMQPPVSKRRRSVGGVAVPASAATEAADGRAGAVLSSPAPTRGARGTPQSAASATAAANSLSDGSGEKEKASPIPAKTPSAQSVSSQAKSEKSEKPEKPELLFSRVRVLAGSDPQKARVTGVQGNDVEVVTEGSWMAMNVNIGDISVIDESNFGAPVSQPSKGPSDFSAFASTEADDATDAQAGIEEFDGTAAASAEPRLATPPRGAKRAEPPSPSPS